MSDGIRIANPPPCGTLSRAGEVLCAEEMMERTRVAGCLSCGLCAAVPVRAQPAPARIAWFPIATESDALPFLDALRSGLRELGYAEDRNLLIEPHWANASAERAATLPPRSSLPDRTRS